jgi:hypothetical protein
LPPGGDGAAHGLAPSRELPNPSRDHS